MQLKVSNFGGAIYKVDPRLLPDGNAQMCSNASVLTGALIPLDPDGLESSLSTDAVSVYNYTWNIVDNWLQWSTDVDVRTGPVAKDQFNRIYYTGSGAPKVRYVNIRRNSTAYLVGMNLVWSTGTTRWTCTYSGVTAATAPDISAISVGGTILDGTAVFTRLSDSATVETEVNLGIPKPTNKITATAVDKSSTSWTRAWKYWYEETDGTKIGEADLPVTPTTTTVGEKYTLPSASVPSRPAEASLTAVFVMVMQASSITGAILGRVYPEISKYYSSSDLYINGAKVTAVQSTTGDRVFTLSYDTSENSEYVSDRSYVYTFVSCTGEEGPPSDPSDTISVDPNKDVQLTNLDSTTQPSGGYNTITRKRIYRTVTSNAGTQYQFVAEIEYTMFTWDAARVYTVGDTVVYIAGGYQCISAPPSLEPPTDTNYWVQLGASAQYLDNLTDAEVAETIPSTTWEAPDSSLAGLTSLPGQFFTAFKDKTLYFSEISQPHAWPAAYAIDFEDTIVGLGTSGNMVVVLTNKYPMLVSAQAPTSTSIAKIPAPQACVSKRSIVEMGGAVLYASQDGICAIADNTCSVVSDPFMTKLQWAYFCIDPATQVYDPSKVICFAYDEFIYVSTPATTFGFRPSDQRTAIIELSDIIYGYYDDRVSDILYFIKSSGTTRSLYSYQGGSSPRRTVTWKSKEYLSQLPVKWSAARILATTYPITLNILANNTQVTSVTATTDKAFWLPVLRREKAWSFIVTHSSNAVIKEVVLSSGFNEL